MSNETERPEDRQKISMNAYTRILALHEQEIQAAKMIANPGCYADFFVEGSGPPWQEAFASTESSIEKIGAKKLANRMAFVDRIRSQPLIFAREGFTDFNVSPYSDFFVDSLPNGPWHEAWTETIFGSRDVANAEQDPATRVRVLSKLKVIQAYQRMRERELF